ncbi:nicotinate phosphoribosyltransferase [Entomospira culicis]|uniref:Nicotinate phosphoribosyltransferase n=1 Tax=Entomospira culicis TaxID=2719989 RepID=A0A968GIH7_9SPIO|nr:nicotinate phosphoribosyltransferase [Entomospira culicis]NIZ19418.1 nicotinate phosphoribosyltransferase [Entomospira culicis]NIZ69677.1 nicotinate phosphoribosyltransferase [Entomospira culicis]WDI36787.1 nicotinate phosphoribosyltransferase [Entomospira culicis]WDI38416.1 nicotinate phosphoribosyltransferase [Entomospira culicis]
MNILTDFARFINSDRYQYTESEVYLANQMHQQASIFNYFFRKTEDSNFAVVVGTESALSLVNMINHTKKDVKAGYFQKLGLSADLQEYLMEAQFNGDIYAMREGELSFAGEPVLTLLGDLVLAKIIETPLLNSFNYQMTIASKASRITRSAGEIPVLAFGPRRAHGFDASVLGTKAALIGGCAMHSAMATEYFYGAPSIGSMSHSYIQSFGVGKEAEYLAFKTFANQMQRVGAPSIYFLIDTYDTLKSGLMNAIKIFQEIAIEHNEKLTYGIRLDSGDLAYFSKMCRKELDLAGLHRAKILLTNSLNEHLISELKQQGAPFDLIGVGDSIATSKDNPCFGGVYKLVEMEGKPVIKLSNDSIKISTPYHKDVYRIYQQGEAKADLITMANGDSDRDLLLAGKEITIISEEDRLKATTFLAGSYEVERLTQPMMINGELTELGRQQSNLTASRAYYQQRLTTFSSERKRLVNPHHYKVNLSTPLYEEKYRLIRELNEEIHR